MILPRHERSSTGSVVAATGSVAGSRASRQAGRLPLQCLAPSAFLSCRGSSILVNPELSFSLVRRDAMRSPFPGMDPYIEAAGLWEDFHHNLITEIQGAISAILPERYLVRAGERSYVTLSAHGGQEEFLTQPDVGGTRLSGAGESTATVGLALLKPVDEPAAPISMRSLVETEYREGFLEIRELQPERKLVTCIEVLSPSNKRAGTAGWLQYTRKRQAYLEGAAHFVEIDLLRGGRRMPMADWPDSPYYLLVSRKQEAPRCMVWPTHSSRPLPPIPIPLVLPTRTSPWRCSRSSTRFMRSRYDRDVDYARPVDPSWSQAEGAWLQERLRERQRPT